jgi:hypothetical protein
VRSLGAPNLGLAIGLWETIVFVSAGARLAARNGRLLVAQDAIRTNGQGPSWRARAGQGPGWLAVVRV